MRDPQPRDAAAPKGPRASSNFRHPSLHHNLPFIPHSRQHPAPVRLRARTAWMEGWLPLGSLENALGPGDTCLSNASCELCPWASPLAFFWGIEEPSRNPTKRSRPESHRHINHYEI